MPDTIDIDAMLDAAIARHDARDLDHAERLYRDILRAEPDHAEALNLLGLVLQDRGRIEELIALITRAIEIDPAFPDPHANLARGLSAQGQPEQAAEAARKAIELDPELGEAWLQLGRAQLALHYNKDALEALRRAATHFPHSTEIHAGIGFAAQRLGDHPAAAEAWRAVLATEPNRQDALVNLGAALSNLDQLDEALALHRQAVAQRPDDVTALGALAATLHRRFAAADLVATCQTILQREPDRLDIMTMLASGLIWLGRFDEARSTCEAALRLDPDLLAVRQLQASLRPDTLTGETKARLRHLLSDQNLPARDRVAAGFTLAKAFDRDGDADAAFPLFQAANAILHAHDQATGNAFDLSELRAYVDWARATFSASTFTAFDAAGNPSELPVFIVGMPRSGTSLVEQIAASHPRVFGAGERKDIADILRRINGIAGNIAIRNWNLDQTRREADQQVARLATLGGDAKRVIDKLPDNIQALGQIRLLFPNARIVVCRRDLRDIGLSCFTTHFGDGINWSCDLEECAHRTLEIERLMDHWRAVLPGPLLEIDYETLVTNLEAESQRLIAFLGLDWDPVCLDFHKTQRSVTTASAVQVREPIYASSIGRWRRYETHLAPMLRILAERTAPPETLPDPLAVEAVRHGMTAMTAGDFPGAILILRDAAVQFPQEHDLHAALGLALGQNKEYEAAIESWHRALALRPDQPHSLANIGVLLSKLERFPESAAMLRRAIALNPADHEYHQALGLALWESRDVTGAHAAWRRVVELAPTSLDGLMALGHCEAALGDFDTAAALYRKSLALNPQASEARAALLSIGRANETGDIADLRATLADPAKPEDDRVWAGFALAQVLEKAGDFDGAFGGWKSANDLAKTQETRAGQIYDPVQTTATVAKLVEFFPARVFPATRGLGDPSDLPVFIVGVPRSGTSLVEQIIATHPKAYGAGERMDIFAAIQAIETTGSMLPPEAWDPAHVRREAAAEVERLRAVGGEAIRVTDKLPGNIFWLGHIRVMLPNARIIICRRDPRDIGISCFANNFRFGHEWTHDLSDIAAQIRATDRMMTHWRRVLPGPVMEIQYEDLVANPETESRRLIDFLGLDWDPACLEFHRTARPVVTASAWQVRQRMYDRSIGRWRHYRRHLGPLMEGLRGLVPLDDDAPVP